MLRDRLIQHAVSRLQSAKAVQEKEDCSLADALTVVNAVMLEEQLDNLESALRDAADLSGRQVAYELEQRGRELCLEVGNLVDQGKHLRALMADRL
jgi:hypothetical protein